MEGAEAAEVLTWALSQFHPRIALSTNLQDSVLVHMAAGIRPDVRIFSLDTGRLHEETYEFAEEVQRRFKVRIEWLFPRHDLVEKLERGKGLFSFRESLENRKECCHIRKVEPLGRALAGLDAWITGMRREESVTRESIRKVEPDAAHPGVLKINPLADWSDAQMRDYIRAHDLPVNRLMKRGYMSIGCAPCTRPVEAGEHPRAGRWWWEQAEHKECGLHPRNWTI